MNGHEREQAERERDGAWHEARQLADDGFDAVEILDKLEAGLKGGVFSPWASQRFVRDVELLVESSRPWITRAAVSIVRSYGSFRIDARWLAELIDGYRSGRVPSWERHAAGELVLAYQANGLLWPSVRAVSDQPQYPDDHQPWMNLVAAVVCETHGIRGSADPQYIANVIAGELHRKDQPQHARRAR